MIETFIRRPVFTTMFILLLVVFGIRCYPEIGVDLNPDVDMPIVSVRVTTALRRKKWKRLLPSR